MRELTCEKYIGSEQCGKPASVRVYPDDRDKDFWYACSKHAPEDGHQTVNGGRVGVTDLHGGPQYD